MPTTRRRLVGTALLLAGLSIAMPAALGHHGWAWATDEEFTLTGKVLQAKLGNPHGELTVDSSGERWLIEVGQPWRNERAGLTPQLLNPGRVITVHGHRSAKKGERLMKAERVVIEGRSYDLYPDRKS